MRDRKYHIKLTDMERRRALAIVNEGYHQARQIVRANVLLELDENGNGAPLPDQTEIARRCHCGTNLVYCVSRQYVQKGFDEVLNRKTSSAPVVPPVLTGAAQAKILALCCRKKPPEGHRRWTLRLLAAKAVEMGIVEHLSASSVGILLKKKNVRLTGE